MGIEPTAFPLPRGRSATELRWLWVGRDLHPRRQTASRFTACPVWLLRYPPKIFSFKKHIKAKEQIQILNNFFFVFLSPLFDLFVVSRKQHLRYFPGNSLFWTKHCRPGVLSILKKTFFFCNSFFQ